SIVATSLTGGAAGQIGFQADATHTQWTSTFTVNGGNLGVGTAAPQTLLDVAGSAQFGSSAKSTFTAAGALTLASGAALNLSGAAGDVIGQSSITTAGAFFGDASHLSNVTATNLSGG